MNFALQASPFALIGAWAETWVMPRHVISSVFRVKPQR